MGASFDPSSKQPDNINPITPPQKSVEDTNFESILKEPGFDQWLSDFLESAKTEKEQAPTEMNHDLSYPLADNLVAISKKVSEVAENVINKTTPEVKTKAEFGKAVREELTKHGDSLKLFGPKKYQEKIEAKLKDYENSVDQPLLERFESELAILNELQKLNNLLDDYHPTHLEDFHKGAHLSDQTGAPLADLPIVRTAGEIASKKAQIAHLKLEQAESKANNTTESQKNKIQTVIVDIAKIEAEIANLKNSKEFQQSYGSEFDALLDDLEQLNTGSSPKSSLPSDIQLQMSNLSEKLQAKQNELRTLKGKNEVGSFQLEAAKADLELIQHVISEIKARTPGWENPDTLAASTESMEDLSALTHLSILEFKSDLLNQDIQNITEEHDFEPKQTLEQLKKQSDGLSLKIEDLKRQKKSPLIEPDKTAEIEQNILNLQAELKIVNSQIYHLQLSPRDVERKNNAWAQWDEVNVQDATVSSNTTTEIHIPLSASHPTLADSILSGYNKVISLINQKYSSTSPYANGRRNEIRESLAKELQIQDLNGLTLSYVDTLTPQKGKEFVEICGRFEKKLNAMIEAETFTKILNNAQSQGKKLNLGKAGIEQKEIGFRGLGLGRSDASKQAMKTILDAASQLATTEAPASAINELLDAIRGNSWATATISKDKELTALYSEIFYPQSKTTPSKPFEYYVKDMENATNKLNLASDLGQKLRYNNKEPRELETVNNLPGEIRLGKSSTSENVMNDLLFYTLKADSIVSRTPEFKTGLNNLLNAIERNEWAQAVIANNPHLEQSIEKLKGLAIPVSVVEAPATILRSSGIPELQYGEHALKHASALLQQHPLADATKTLISIETAWSNLTNDMQRKIASGQQLSTEDRTFCEQMTRVALAQVESIENSVLNDIEQKQQETIKRTEAENVRANEILSQTLERVKEATVGGNKLVYNSETGQFEVRERSAGLGSAGKSDEAKETLEKLINLYDLYSNNPALATLHESLFQALKANPWFTESLTNNPDLQSRFKSIRGDWELGSILTILSSLNKPENEGKKPTLENGEIVLKKRSIGREKNVGTSGESVVTMMHILTLCEEQMTSKKSIPYIKAILEKLNDTAPNQPKTWVSSVVSKNEIVSAKLKEITTNLNEIEKSHAENVSSSQLEHKLNEEDYCHNFLLSYGFLIDEIYDKKTDTRPDSVKLFSFLESVFVKPSTPFETKVNILNMMNEWITTPFIHGGKVEDMETRTAILKLIDQAIKSGSPTLTELAQAVNTELEKILSEEAVAISPEIVDGKNEASDIFAAIALGGIPLDSQDYQDAVDDFASSLTSITVNSFSTLSAPEFARLAWSKEDLKPNSPSIIAVTNSFNAINNFVLLQLMGNKDITFDKLALQISFLMDVVDKLLTPGTDDNPKTVDIHSAFAVMGAINNSAISRLRSEIDPKIDPTRLDKFNENSKITDTVKAYAAQRQFQNNLGQASFVPYFGIYLTDLTFTSDGNPSKSEGQVNANKAALIGSTLSVLQEAQRNLKPSKNPVFNTASILATGDSKEIAYEASLALKARGK